MIRQRIVTGVLIMVAMISLAVFLPLPLFALFLGIIWVMACLEWTSLIPLKAPMEQVGYMGLVLALMGLAWIVPVIWVCFVGVLIWFVLFILIRRYPVDTRWFRPLNIGILGIGCLIPAWVALLNLRLLFGVPLLLVVFLMIWATDTAAYQFGRWFGRRKLAPQVSPGKTIAGAVWGVLLGSVMLGVSSYLFSIPVSNWILYLLLGVFSIVLSIVGDLSVSVLKRQQHLKDTGWLLPGHGGLLDRLDSLLAAAPCFLLGLLLLDVVKA